MGGAGPGQELFESYCCQLAQMTYTLGLAHCHWLPAAPSAIKPTFEKMVEKMFQIHGVLGISGDAPLARLFREVRPFRIYDGPSERTIARRALREARA
jgi:acyl-CoA dehydrogenase